MLARKHHATTHTLLPDLTVNKNEPATARGRRIQYWEEGADDRETPTGDRVTQIIDSCPPSPAQCKPATQRDMRTTTSARQHWKRAGISFSSLCPACGQHKGSSLSLSLCVLILAQDRMCNNYSLR